MDTPGFKEYHISQIPALQMLVNLGYTYLSPAETDRQRGGKTTNVLPEDVLRKQLTEINSIRVSATKTSIFTDDNIDLPKSGGSMVKSNLVLLPEFVPGRKLIASKSAPLGNCKTSGIIL